MNCKFRFPVGYVQKEKKGKKDMVIWYLFSMGLELQSKKTRLETGRSTLQPATSPTERFRITANGGKPKKRLAGPPEP
jgi:hypothetical protein